MSIRAPEASGRGQAKSNIKANVEEAQRRLAKENILREDATTGCDKAKKLAGREAVLRAQAEEEGEKVQRIADKEIISNSVVSPLKVTIHVNYMHL